MKENLSVLHLYSGNLYGGIESMLATLARCSDLEPRLQMEYALCFPGRIRDELMAAGALVHDLGLVRFSRPWTLLRARHRLNRILRERRYDFVITHAFWPHALFAPVVRRMSQTLVFWQHDFAGSGHWIERLARLTQPDLVISNSEASAATLPRPFSSVDRHVIRCPVMPPIAQCDPVNERLRVRRELSTAPDAVVFIQTSRLEPWKGQANLLDAVIQLRDHPSWVVWLVGGAQRPHERTYLAELKTQASEAGVADRVRFLGERSDVFRLLQAADIACQPNQGPEPFGIAFIEALHAGLPVVSMRMGGAVEIIDETCGILVEPGDVVALSDVLRRLIDDPLERARLARGGPARAVDLCDPGRTLRTLSERLASSKTAEESGQA